MATEQDLLVARIYLRAVLPVIKVLLEDDPKTARKFANTRATVQFVARDGQGPVGAYLQFADGGMEVVQGIAEHPDLTFGFSSVAKMNALFAGKPALPRIRGWLRLGLLVKMLGLLMGLKLLLPTRKTKTPEETKLKVKMTLYMVTTALSQLNKAGYPAMVKWTSKQPERIYQWSVNGSDIACYVKVKAGNTKSGRGLYTRRMPFVHTRFRSTQDALPLLANQVDTVEAMRQGLVAVEGSPEYGGQISDFMLRIAKMIT